MLAVVAPAPLSAHERRAEISKRKLAAPDLLAEWSSRRDLNPTALLRTDRRAKQDRRRREDAERAKATAQKLPTVADTGARTKTRAAVVAERRSKFAEQLVRRRERE
jgi:hypothetical protein